MLTAPQRSLQHPTGTTAVVRDLPGLTMAQYVGALRTTIADEGWPPALADELAPQLQALAEQWEPERVIERHLDRLQYRFEPDTALLAGRMGLARRASRC